MGISGVFLLLVGLSIPPFFNSPEAIANVNWAEVAGHGEKLPGALSLTCNDSSDFWHSVVALSQWIYNM